MNDQEAEDLLKRFLAGKLSDEELSIVDGWYQNLAAGEELPDTNPDLKQVKTDIWKKVRKKPVIRFYRYAAAASILMILSFGAYFFLEPKIVTPPTTALNQKHDIAPGSNKATITLANGQQLVVNSSKVGFLTNQGSVAINIKNGNQVVYSANQQTIDNDLQYNTMTTPKGGQYSLTLSDGTKIWLDAASSITYPVTFTGKERKVQITGQVYFEVEHDASKPFKVTTNGQTVEVLGTHFNINAYVDEPVIKTTLFEGSIKISKASNYAILKPGQQAKVKEGTIKIVPDADTEEAIAWHKGLFKFNGADIPSVMRQLSRWYDVDITYEGKVSDRQFSGKIYRNISALKVSDILSYNDIHFRIEGKKIIVEP